MIEQGYYPDLIRKINIFLVAQNLLTNGINI